MNQLRMGPWHARHPSTPQQSHLPTHKPPTVPLIQHWAKDAYQLSATPGELLTPCCAFVLLSCNSICLKIAFVLTDVVSFWWAAKGKRIICHFVSKNWIYNKFSLSHCHRIFSFKSHASWLKYNCGACLDSVKCVCAEMNVLNKEMRQEKHLGCRHLLWRINKTQIKLEVKLNVTLTYCLCTFQGWFTLNDRLLNQTCLIHSVLLLSQAVKSQLRPCCGCLLMDCNGLRCISSAESLSNWRLSQWGVGPEGIKKWRGRIWDVLYTFLSKLHRFAAHVSLWKYKWSWWFITDKNANAGSSISTRS